MLGRHPIGFFANEERHGRNTGRNHSPLALARVREGCGMRRKASPTHGTGKAKLVKPFRVVVCDSARENLPLPGVGGAFKTLQLAKNFQGSTFARDLRAGRDVLPAKK